MYSCVSGQYQSNTSVLIDASSVDYANAMSAWTQGNPYVKAVSFSENTGFLVLWHISFLVGDIFI